MKKLLTTITIVLCLFMMKHDVAAQETYGNTLNIGLGVGGHAGYTRYASQALPVLNINYEFDVAPNFTVAPFLSLYTYSNNYYWTNRNYRYRETVIPVGVKGLYYFDELFDSSNHWDFYAGASLGFAIVNSRWEEGFDGDREHFNRGSSIFLDAHIGVEYHFNSKIGAFLDLSSGISTIGIAIH